MLEGADGTGKLARILYAKGYGFIAGANGRTYFFHASEAQGFERMNPGDAVRFIEQQTDSGWRAVRVRPA